MQDAVQTILHSPAAERNQRPILDSLTPWLSDRHAVLEIASGTGQHAVFLSQHLAHLTWQPSDLDPSSLASISARRLQIAGQTTGSAVQNNLNLLPPVRLDVESERWPVKGEFDALFCANMIHIAPWSATQALFKHAKHVCSKAAKLMTYGPFIFEDVQTAQSNVEFDASLQARNPAWGIRHFTSIRAEAQKSGWRFEERKAMPANNFCLLFRYE